MASKESTTELARPNINGDIAAVNKTKIYYGIFKEQQLVVPLVDEEEDEGDDDGGAGGDESRAKKKKNKGKTLSSKKMKADPHAPPAGRVPLPEISDSFKLDRQNASKEIMKRAKLCPPDKLASVCQYTIMNAQNGICCCDVTEDSTTLAIGCDDSLVRVWTLTSDKLKPLKKAADLEDIDKDADDVMDQMLDESLGSTSVEFVGHSGPVYGCSFSPDKRMLLTCSEDASIRLWSMYTWTSLAIYRLGGFPIWDVKFGPLGYYFATASSDKTALVWALDKPQPLRILVGHESDVNTVAFHPNSNYIATGSDDCTVRIWDISNGQCVRHFAGHKGGIHTLQFSGDGRLLASGGTDGHVILWSVGQGRQMVDLEAHEATVHAITFSREGAVMATGGMDNKVKVHYLQPILAGGVDVDDHHSNASVSERMMDTKPTSTDQETKTEVSLSTSGQVVIDVQTSSSPRSPRLAHLRPVMSPLTPEAMHRIHLMTVRDPRMALLSPVSPSTSLSSPTTSDLGSSRRSSANVTTCSSSSSAWSGYRDTKKSSSDFTDVDSDLSKDLFSPTITLSPAPFSPFSEHSPAAVFTEQPSTSSLMRQRLHFTFDHKSPVTTGQFLLPPTPTYGPQRGRSWSDGDTVVSERTRIISCSGLAPTEESEEGGGSVLVPTKVDSDKNVYKKRLLRKYKEDTANVAASATMSELTVDTGPDIKPFPGPGSEQPCPKSVTLPLVHPHTFPQSTSRLLARCASSLPDYGRGCTVWSEGESSRSHQHLTPVESIRLPLMRLEEATVPKTEPAFGAWLNRQLFTINPLWSSLRSNIGGHVGQRDPVAYSALLPLLTPPLTTPPRSVPPESIRSIFRPSPIYPPHLYLGQHRYFPPYQPPMPSPPGRRSRSESDACYECHQCGQSFSLRDRLAKHLASRHKEQCVSGAREGAAAAKSYKCTVCQKQFGRSDMLTRHMRLHTGIRPYVCRTCGQVFSRSDHLSTHQRTHTGEKPYQCPVCPYAASRRDMITRHMRTHSRHPDVCSEEASTSGICHVTEAFDQSGISETGTSDVATGSVRRQPSTPEKSPGSESDRHSVGSTGSTSTILCVEGEEGAHRPKTEPS